MLIEITHQNVFEYGEPVSESYLEFRMTPLTDGRQHLLLHRTRVTPQRPVRQYVDAWGNSVSYLNLLESVSRLEVSYDSVVETLADPSTEPASPHGPAAPRGADGRSSTARLMLYDYLQPTALTDRSEELSLYLRPLERLRGAAPREAAEALRETIHHDFRYERDVTTSSSPVAEVLRLRAGVSQDFAHVMLAACRYLGFPARYVSGYVMPGESRPAASHAWCQVFDLEEGWFGVDPTHNRWVDERYVRLGFGRDYRDVAPNRGVFRGKNIERLEVHVGLKVITADEVEARTRALFRQARGAVAFHHEAGRAAVARNTDHDLQSHQQQQQ